MNGAPQFPAELVERQQWCLWRIERDHQGRPTKVPYRPDGRKASSNDPTTWSTFSAVNDLLVRKPGAYGGAGYFFAADDGVCGIDLDVSLDSAAEPQIWATDIIARFHDTYCERSLSGYGLHMLCHARLPGKGRNFNIPNGPADPKGKRAQIGLFDRGRFFALTGRLYDQSPLTVGDHQKTIEWLLHRMQPQNWRNAAEPEVDSRELTDSEIIERAHRATNGRKFEKLWAGEWEPDYASQSEADLALCCILVFWCGPSPSRINALFRQSGLVREKWLGREDYRERTIQAAIEQTTQFHNRETPARMSVRETTAVYDPLPEIWVGARQLPVMTRQALAALQAANNPATLFVRGGRMVAVVRDERDRQVIVEVSESSLRGRLARSGFYYRLNRQKERIECAPPLDLVRDVLALPPVEWNLPRLEGFVEAPCLRADGTICDTPGYDPAGFLFYAPAPDLRVSEIPKAPMIDDVHAALELLDSAIGDFPFVDQASKANAIASMLTPLVRPAIASPTPLALFDAPQAGTGKSLLADVVSIIATGRAADMLSAPREPEEWRKKITTVLVAGASVVVFDNITQRLDADSLCAALTATTISDRAFRTFDPIVAPVRCTWIATGNNVQLGGDMPRRCYWIRLDAEHSRPFERTSFRHLNLRTWVLEHRGALIAALLLLARYWYQQGRREPTRVRPLGSFEAWAITIGGILEEAGVEGFLGNGEAMFEQADQEAIQWECFLLVLDDEFKGESFRVTDIVEKLARTCSDDTRQSSPLRRGLPDFLAEAADRTDGFFQRRLGKCFAERLGRRFGETQVFLTRAEQDRKAKVQRWTVVNPHGGVTNPASAD